MLGARLVQAWADPDLSVAVRGAMSKFESILPEPLQESMLKTALFGPPLRLGAEARGALLELRRAIGEERWLRLRYVDGAGAGSERSIVPLGLYFWGKIWLLAAYCWLRNDYRSFRVDRIAELSAEAPDAGKLASVEPAVNLEGYLRVMEERSREEFGSACGLDGKAAENRIA